MDEWVHHAIGFMDAIGLEQTDLVGNSFGGGLALALAIRHPSRVRRLVLMGSVGVPFEITPGLDAVWGYTPSFDNMRTIMDLFAYDRSLVNDELAELRFQASNRPGFQESYARMFPAPRQRWMPWRVRKAIFAICRTTLWWCTGGKIGSFRPKIHTLFRIGFTARNFTSLVSAAIGRKLNTPKDLQHCC
jgi:pimeloyl-ACP methyl ester carboxylesterase